MKVLVAGEQSQIVTEAFINKGHDAMSCDIQYEGALGLPHYRGDLRDLLTEYFDLVIFHPVCKRLTNSGVRWQDVWTASPGPEREKLRSITYPGVAAAMADQWGSLSN